MSVAMSAHNRPYPGMRPFEPAEANLFFGQDTHITALLRRLGNSRLIAVFGESGCGKSSIIKAGLIPRLVGDRLEPRSALWRVAISRPAKAPIQQLAEALAAALDSDAGTVDRRLRSSSYGLLEVVRDAHLPQGRRVLIVVDQFEELFRFTREAEDRIDCQDEAALFVKLLLAATESSALATSGLPVYIVLTMRSEYLGDCARFFGLAEAVNDGAYLLPKMTRADVEAAITGPLPDLQARIDNDLLQCLLNETEAARQDGLPLLQHALRRIWDAAIRRPAPVRLTMADFESVAASPPTSGTLLLERHLNAHLDDIWGSLPRARQRTCEKLFKQLGEYDTKSRLVRRSSDLGTVANTCGVDLSTALQVVNAFRDEALGRTFLMPPASRTEALLTGAEPLDLSHEALLRRWTRLRGWMREETKDAEEFRLLADWANKHIALKGAELTRALSWKKRTRPTEAWSHRYAGWDAEQKRPRYRFQHTMDHLERCRRRNRLRWLGASSGALVVATAVAIALFTYRDSQRQQAFQQQLLAKAGALSKAVVARDQAIAAQLEIANQLKAERDQLKLTKQYLETNVAELLRFQNDLRHQVQRTSEANDLAQQRLAGLEAAQRRADALNLSLRKSSDQLKVVHFLVAAADARRIADQQFRFWADLVTPDDPEAVRSHLAEVTSAGRSYARAHTELPSEAVRSIRRAVAASFLTASAEVTSRSPVLLAMPDAAHRTRVVAIRQGADLTGGVSADAAAWSIQRSSAIPGGSWVVGGPGGFAALRSADLGDPSVRKFHPFAVSGLGLSTDGEWIASASAGGDMRLLRRGDLVSGSKIAQGFSRFLNTGKLLTFMLLQRYKGDYAVREFALSVGPHEGRPAQRRDVTVVALTETDRLLIWRRPGPLGKQIRGVDQLEVGGRYAAIGTDPSTQLVWAARVQPVHPNEWSPIKRTQLGTLETGAAAAFSDCEGLSDGRAVMDMSWDADGDRLAIGFQDGTVRVFVRTGRGRCQLEPEMELPAHTAAVTTVTWHDHVLATGASDGSARLWNLDFTEEDRRMFDALRQLDHAPVDLEATFGLLAARVARLNEGASAAAGESALVNQR